ncbi:MAG: Txe/YoeB family addiction module toxin [Bacteroidetes bacterium]|nr:MAG: Txe/YoeB family addiction module toxin [Bacteroidota bacterium]
MRIIFSENSWDDYTYWLRVDKRMLTKINDLIKGIQRTPYKGKGKPEALKYDLSGYWSRRINGEHRLVYKIYKNDILIYSCRYHYD